MDNLKEINIKNRTCYHFDDIIKIGIFLKILSDEKSSESILVYEISYKNLIGGKPLRVRFVKVDGFIKVYDGTRHLVLFGPEKYDAIYNRIRYLISQKSGITYVYSHNFARIKFNSYDYLPLERTLTLYYVVIFIKSIFNKNQNHYHYNIFLEKCLYQLAEK